MREFTKEHRENLRKAALIAQNKPNQINKLRSSKLGINNPQWGKKWSKSRKIRFSKMMKSKPVKYWLGKHQPKELIKKRFENRKGYRHSLETRKKIGIANSGENQWNWKGGVTPLTRKIRRCAKYIQWRLDIFQRDNWTCLTCQNRGGNLQAHHLKSFYKILEENKIKTYKQALNCKELWEVNNGITLCNSCHQLTKKGNKHD